MKSPLARALLKVGAVLVAFALLGFGGWYAVAQVTDQRLLERLQSVSGLTEISPAEDRIVVHVASDLAPAAAQQTVDDVMLIAKNQQPYRSHPIELVQGAFTATMRASAPGVPPGEYRGDVASLLNGLGGITAGRLTPGGAVEVRLAADQGLLEWSVTAAELLEGAGLRANLQVADASTELSFVAGREPQRHLLWASYHAITGAGASIESLLLRHTDTGTRLSGELTAPDRGVATAVLEQLTGLLDQPSAGEGLAVQIAGDVQLVGLGDVPGTLAFVDHLRADGLQVPRARTDRSRVEVIAANPQALDLLLAKATEPGWALSADSEISVLAADTEYGGLVARNDNLETRARIYQQLWRTGFPDVFVGTGDAPKGATLGFLISEPERNDFTDPDTQIALITALRDLDWQGRASFSLSPDPQASTLSFISTADGQASDIIKPRAIGGRWWHRAGWGQHFLDEWNATATD